MKRLALMLLLILIGLASASADVVHLRDGSSREGRIIQETDDVVTVEIALGSTKARVAIPRADIDHIEKKLTEQEKLEAEFAKRLKALDKSNADAVVELGKWCISKKLFVEAEKLYRDLSARDDAGFTRGNLALAEMEYDRGRLVLAKTYLKAILDKNPKDLDAKLIWDRISDDEKSSAQKLLSDAVDLAAKGKPDAALDKLESFHDRVSEEYAKDALSKVKFPGGMKLEEFAAELRLSVPCPSCKGGVKVCPVCKGKPDPDGGVCRTCADAGTAVCDKCGGTSVTLGGDVPDWELPELARAVEKRATEWAEEFHKEVKALGGNVPPEALTALASKAELAASRAIAWLSELDAISAAGKGLTTHDARAEREALEREWRQACAALGEAFDRRGSDAWAKIEASETGALAQEEATRTARNDLARALAFYGKMRAGDKGPLPEPAGSRVTALGPLVTELDQTVARNAKILKAFDVALKHAVAYSGSKPPQLGRARAALDIFVEIAKVATQQDLAYLSQLMTRKTNSTLDTAMAVLRFDLGREKGEFGDTVEYERPAFLKRLITEAETMAAQARSGSQSMMSYAALGKRNSVPTSLVRRTREQAQDARRWLKAALTVPYPLSRDKREQVDQDIDDMTSIISRCSRWYVGGPGGIQIGN